MCNIYIYIHKGRMRDFERGKKKVDASVEMREGQRWSDLWLEYRKMRGEVKEYKTRGDC